MGIDELVVLLKEKGFGEDAIERMINEKKESIGSHITDEGIISLIAAEHGITETVESPELTIDKITDGLMNLHLITRVLRVFDKKEFIKEDKKKKQLQSFLLGDPTGKIYLTLWDRELDIYNKIHDGNVIRLINCISVKGPSGPQLRLGYKGRIIVEDESNFPELTYKSPQNVVRKKLIDISPGEHSIEIRATISNIYRLLIYDACPTCHKRAIKSKDSFFCDNCKIRIVPKKAMVVEIGIDDGTNHIRAVLFSDSASELLGESPDNIARDLQGYLDAGYTGKSAGLEYILEKKPDILGKEIVLIGSISENEYTGININVQDIRPLEFNKETQNVLSILECDYGE